MQHLAAKNSSSSWPNRWQGNSQAPAWSPGLSCRILAEMFKRFAADRRMTVGKTYVSTYSNGIAPTSCVYDARSSIAFADRNRASTSGPWTSLAGRISVDGSD